ncbi:phBC6A51 family helix-turn-helix protein [Leuconostoc falkenbergense]|uniref:phBC6A51 family helix-turn-helix protein n=1 Tax=Leuconostoc falkenbergense TaxID=2766470 RepID=UPI0024A99B1C|nr:phBC6A51 family helix-turn-helix protein [Leuconostoc falkenbergense]MDI6553105.1 phBC6A51 family helix-turn-helix protein [Leuconostoc falkenbergense]
MVYKTLPNGAFEQLDKRRQKAIVMLFEDELSDEQIAKAVNRSRTTLSTWKKEEVFQQAMQEYRHIVVDDFVPDAIKELKKLVLSSKSDMVKFQSVMAVLNLSGYGTIEENPEITQAKIRKLSAEADVAQIQAKRMVDGEQNSSVNVNIVIPEQEDNNGE